MRRFKSGANLDDILGRADGLVQVDVHEAAALIEKSAYRLGASETRRHRAVADQQDDRRRQRLAAAIPARTGKDVGAGLGPAATTTR